MRDQLTSKYIFLFYWQPVFILFWFGVEKYRNFKFSPHFDQPVYHKSQRRGRQAEGESYHPKAWQGTPESEIDESYEPTTM